EELIALADNECLRAIRIITNHKFNLMGEWDIQNLFAERKKITKQKNSQANKNRIANINNKIRDLLYIPEYICITFPNGMKKKDYSRLNTSGFVINNIKYKWLLCGASHQRTNKAFYCGVNIYDRLNEVLSCGAKNIPIILPKYNAYFALSSSASMVVSTPRVCVVPDYEIKMNKNVDWVEHINDNNYNIDRVDKELSFNLWDGMGIISPDFANKWASELDLDFLPSCWCIRSAFIKGMVCIMDFHKYSKDIANKNIIKDLWGNNVNTDDIDMIITQSQFKLWNAYDSWQDYESKQQKYCISWGVTKTSPKQDDDFVMANYQYLQVLDISDKDIDKLCKETIDWMCGVSKHLNYEYKLLYLLGKLTKNKDEHAIWKNIQDNSLKALLLDKELVNDSYFSTKIIQSLRKKIKQSYLGKIIIHGNYQTRISDPYGFMEYIYGLPVVGLLKENEHYMDYWNKKNIDKVVAMRSPLTWRSEAHILNLKQTPQMKEWYKYLNSGIVYNLWGCDCMLEADADFDMDATCTTNNEIFLKGVIK
ncbi:MAG: hypothetical protein M0R51_13410, partial [Clostridia bacterium]|nr:hypothetical protein [Clostridia bacterium]